MKTNVDVVHTSLGWVVIHRNVQVGTPFADENRARLAAHHYTHAPALQKRLKIRRLKNERGLAYVGRPFWCVNVRIQKVKKGGECPWQLQVWVDEVLRPVAFYTSLQSALRAVQAVGREKTTTNNILNPSAGEFEISRGEKGSCTDPGTERYHSM